MATDTAIQATEPESSQGDPSKGAITDLASFKTATGHPREVAALYFYATLDCLVDLAHAISQDFFQRPQLYTSFRDNTTAPIIAKLHAHYGSDEGVPSKEQREEIFSPIFGLMQGTGGLSRSGDFNHQALQLMNACSAFAQRAFDSGISSLREGVRTAQRALKDYLESLQGESLRWSTEQALGSVTEPLAYQLFRNAGVTAIFSGATPASAAWPYGDDANAGTLLEEICKQLPGARPGAVPLTREYYSNLHATAVLGAQALASVISLPKDSNDQDVDFLINRVYAWGVSQRALPQG